MWVFLGGGRVFSCYLGGKKTGKFQQSTLFQLQIFFFEDNVLQNNQPKMFFLKPYPQKKNHRYYSCFSKNDGTRVIFRMNLSWVFSQKKLPKLLGCCPVKSRIFIHLELMPIQRILHELSPKLKPFQQSHRFLISILSCPHLLGLSFNSILVQRSLRCMSP